MLSKLSPSEDRLFELVNAFAFTNPFSPEREVIEAKFIQETGGNPLGTHRERFGAFFRWVDALPSQKRDFRKFPAAARERVRVGLLFDSYFRFTEALDDSITLQVTKGEKGSPVPFGSDCLKRMESYGFSREEALRYFGIFYQLRRAHYFIIRGLKGTSPCMFEFRRRLWNSVFTEDVRWYERHLWNRMEDFSTVILGETGTGKGAAAAAIGRSGFIPYLPEKNEFAESFNRGFVAINLAEFPESLIEAELFGYRKGAFTGAVESHDGVFARCSAHGAIFLDEIGEVNTSIQIKLLHVLQERLYSPVGSREQRRFRGRVISATNRNLDQLRGETFRDDFFYRISSDVITAPPLRQRLAENPGELDLLLRTILERTLGGDTENFRARIRERITQSVGENYPWPGNVRELEQAVRRIILNGQYEPSGTEGASGSAKLAASIEHLEFTAEELLAKYCALAVRLCGTRAEAGRRLGLDVRTVGKYLGKENGATAGPAR